MSAWEYKTIVLTGGISDEETLNQAGAEGWELVAVTSAAGWQDRQGDENAWLPVAFLKRPAPARWEKDPGAACILDIPVDESGFDSTTGSDSPAART